MRFVNFIEKAKMKRKAGIVLILVFCCVWQVQAAVNCTETGAGRFADDDDTTCQNYTLCVYDTTTLDYLFYNYQCPSTSVFNPNIAMCTDPANYVCNVTTANTTVCTEDGYIADPSSTNCSSYIECVGINGTFTETTYTCPDNTFYDPNTTLCESNYTCTSNSSSNNTTETFTCSGAGRFADTTDTTCQTYYYCVLASNGTYVQYEYTCPTTSVFNPNTRVCTTSYTCTTT
ncbi:probable endochitinase [Bombyx mori]|uniref:Chitin-binding type-2 domain-containing protein n=1 Tax=Bombyx mori TaxID=7091 RepID=A0A8R1WI89_BOMMO|nr:probable endochitinase [Bombyx mori]